jgi:polysaccharide biosynthesis transport protein
LTGKADAIEVIFSNIQWGIDFIKCDSAVENPRGTLALRAMRDFIKVQQSYDFVIIDSPAIMTGPDAVILSELADETLMSVRWARTSRKVVNVCLRWLEEGGGARGMAAILNCIDIKWVRRCSVTDALSYSNRMRCYYSTVR